MKNCDVCTFDPGLSLAIVQKGFKKSFKDGLLATKSETLNLITAAREKIAPKNARFDNVANYEFIDNVAYWQGDTMPVVDHLIRNTKLLAVRGASEESMAQARRDEDVWRLVESRLSQLQPGDAIQYLSQKDLDPASGVALQQIVNDNGVLIHQSHLLPFNDVNQINQFISLASDSKRDISLDSDISGWVTVGKRIDFDQELPELMMKSMINKSTDINWQKTVMPIWPQLSQVVDMDLSAMPIDTNIQLENFEDRVISVEPSSFWWQLLATKPILESIELLSEVSAISDQTVVVTTGEQSVTSEVLKPEGVSVVFAAAQSEEGQEIKAKHSFSAMEFQLGSVSGQLKNEVKTLSQSVEKHKFVKEKTVFATEKKTEKNSQIKDSKKENVVISRTDFEKQEGKTVSTAVMEKHRNKQADEEHSSKRKVTEKKKSTIVIDMQSTRRSLDLQQIVKQRESGAVNEIAKAAAEKKLPESPVWHMVMEGLNDNELKEWRWEQLLEELNLSFVVPGLKAKVTIGEAAERAFEQAKWPDFDYLNQSVFIVNTILFAVVNTNWMQNEVDLARVPVMVVDDRGSGLLKMALQQR